MIVREYILMHVAQNPMLCSGSVGQNFVNDMYKIPFITLPPVRIHTKYKQPFRYIFIEHRGNADDELIDFKQSFLWHSRVMRRVPSR